MQKRWCSLLLMAVLILIPFSTQARVTQMVITNTVSPAFDGASFGDVGQYERLEGVMYCEVDPANPLNADIVNIDKAPVNALGLVAFDVDFVIIKPIDVTKGNGRILYDTPNRGRMVTLGAFGEDLLLDSGYTIVSTGWQASYPLPTLSFFVGLGSRLPGETSFTGRFPVAENEDGTPVVGWSREEYYDPPLNVSSNGVFTKFLTYPAADTTDTDHAYLTVRRHERDTNRMPVDWVYVDEYRIQFQEPEGYDPGAIYEFIYQAKDPIVYGLGFAGIRDAVSFLRYQQADDAGNPNPLFPEGENFRWIENASDKKKSFDGGIQYALAYGTSQTGRVIKTFVVEGFNEDENGRKVFDGINTHIGASRKNWLNGQFSHPGDIFGNDQFPFAYSIEYDSLSQRTGGNLEKCEASDTCPKIIHTDSETEIWSSAASLLVTDTRGTRDLKLPDNVRTYMFTGARHGAGPGAYGILPVNPRAQQLENPLNYKPLSRALLVALDDWATKGIRPPRNHYPRLKDHTLVPPEELDFPDIPAFTYNGYDFPAVGYNALYMPAYLLDYNAYPDPPRVLAEYPVHVMNVDKDGNGVAGIRLPDIQVPIGTYTGWNRFTEGWGGDDRLVTASGAFIPFAVTEAERLANGDPRPSLEERYRSHSDYVKRVEHAAKRLVQQRLLLWEDALAIIQAAEDSNICR